MTKLQKMKDKRPERGDQIEEIKIESNINKGGFLFYSYHSLYPLPCAIIAGTANPSHLL